MNKLFFAIVLVLGIGVQQGFTEEAAVVKKPTGCGCGKGKGK